MAFPEIIGWRWLYYTLWGYISNEGGGDLCVTDLRSFAGGRECEEVFWWCCNSSSSFEYSCIKVQCTFYGVRQRSGGERGCFGEVAVEAAFSLVGAPSEDPHQYHASHRATFQLIVILWEKEYLIVILGLGFILFAMCCCGRFLKHLPDKLLPRRTHVMVNMKIIQLGNNLVGIQILGLLALSYDLVSYLRLKLSAA